MAATHVYLARTDGYAAAHLINYNCWKSPARQLWRQTSCQSRQTGGKAASNIDKTSSKDAYHNPQGYEQRTHTPIPVRLLITWWWGARAHKLRIRHVAGPSSCHEEVASDKLQHIRRVTRCQLICAKFLTNLQPLSELVGRKVLPETGHSVAWLPSCLSMSVCLGWSFSQFIL